MLQILTENGASRNSCYGRSSDNSNSDELSDDGIHFSSEVNDMARGTVKSFVPESAKEVII